MKTNVNVLFAKVVTFHPNFSEPEKGYGFADTAEGERFYIPMWACRKIVAGLSAPELSPEEWRQWPKGAEHIGDDLADEIVLIPDLRPPRPGTAPRAYRWGYKKFWDAAARAIEERPIYRVMAENLNLPTEDERREEEIAVGTAEELQAKFPRETSNDPLGTEKPYRSGPCQRINHWFVWDKADWVACEDPRPKSNLTMDYRPASTKWSPGVEGPITELDQELADMGQSRVAKFNAKYHQPVAA